MARERGTAARRVQIVTHTGEIGGAERSLLRLLSVSDERFEMSLLALNAGPLVDEAEASGMRVSVIDGGHVVTTTRGEAASLSRIGTNVRDTMRTARLLRARLRSDDADLVVANSLKAAILVGIAAGRRRWVWHLHDRLSSDYLSVPVVLALRVLARFGPRKVVANSRATAATAGRLPAGRVRVAYPGIEASAFEGPAPILNDGPVGILGRIASTKGQLEFVSAARIVLAERPDLRFRIVGAPLFQDASYAAEVDRLIVASSLTKRIDQLGWTDSPAQTLAEFGVFVHASTTPEPFGQVIVEAMAAGTPVVATDAGGVGEILDPRKEASDIADGVRVAPYGVLVRPGDAGALARGILYVAGDRGAAARRAEAARDRARVRFTVDKTWRVVSTAWESAAR